jgi:LmbE family N-acetylglucosaminyl deacetylase
MNARASEQEVAQPLTARYAGCTVVGIGAHPDDLEIGLGGTLAKLRKQGARVVMAVVSIPKDYEVRRAEAERAAQILGCDLEILFPEGPIRIEDIKTSRLVGAFDALVKEHAPAAVFTHSSADFHNDHLLVHQACLPVQRRAPFDFFSYHPTNCYPVPVNFHPNVYVDISDTIDAKMHAITAHASQFQGRGLDTEIYREYAHVQGRIIGAGYAEGLDAMRMRLA